LITVRLGLAKALDPPSVISFVPGAGATFSIPVFNHLERAGESRDDTHSIVGQNSLSGRLGSVTEDGSVKEKHLQMDGI
jgi:hypothetical protein